MVTLCRPPSSLVDYPYFCQVQVITGPDKGKVGKVFKVLRKKNQLLVEGVNVVRIFPFFDLPFLSKSSQTKRHIRPGQPRESEDQKYWFAESPVHYSNVSHIHPETKKPVKVGFAYLDGEKVRVVRGTDIIIPKPPPPDKEEKRKRGYFSLDLNLSNSQLVRRIRSRKSYFGKLLTLRH